MNNKQVWFITGAGRGMGIDIAKAALAAGHAVIATGRNPKRISSAVGVHEDLLPVKLDVTSFDDAKGAVRVAIDRFGRIDVLVNNAGNFYAGFFEEITPEDSRAQVETTMFGPMNVTRAVLPVMREQRSGLVVAISSTAGIVGPGVLHRLRRLQVRGRGLDRVADPRDRALRHPHDARRARFLQHRVAHAGVDELRQALD
jgi:NAD(P)-dependent dehydrogenase (short-subunit alcohol dehydrogenase family)